MSCAQFDGWLDAGMPVEGAVDARLHATACARCAAAERTALELETALEDASEPTPAPFTAAVLQRIAAPPAATAWSGRSLPLWVRTLAQPSCALSLALALLWIAWFDRVPRLAVGVRAAVDAAFAAAAHVPVPAAMPIRTALALVGVAAFGALSVALFRWSESLARR